MSIRFWLTITTLVLLALVVFFGWDQITQAFSLLGHVNLWILALLVPMQFVSYYAIGEMVFSYLRAKGDLGHMSRLTMTRITLESNFVNHIALLPIAGGSSYLGWILSRHGVSVSRSTMAQIIRHLMSFLAFILLLAASIMLMSFDFKISKIIIITTSIFVAFFISLVIFLVYIISNKKRLMKFSNWVTIFINKIVKIFTIGKKKQILAFKKTDIFFVELHNDYLEILDDKKVLLAPFLWSILSMVLDVMLILITFWALGFSVNPAALFIAFGLSSIGGIFAATPGGSGVYEGIMIAFLVSTGVPADVAIAGTLLSRAILLIITVGFGYLFYQLTINKYGKISKSANI